MKRAYGSALVFTAGIIGVLAAFEREAQACGGCFTPPPPPNESESVITDEKMVLSVSMNQTTLYDQINYSGSPASFAWVLPIKGPVTVGLSADVLFQVINQLTTTQVEQPAANCPPAPASCSQGRNSGAPAVGEGAGSGTGSGVTVLSQKQVGPYETVQLHSNDGSALSQWLTAHGYQISSADKPVIDAYVSQKFDFLALKLVPGKGVQSMQPVRVTSQGAAPSLPLHMVAVGTGPTTGISIWVIADARWAPSNFPTFTIADSELAWDWATNSSNYESLRLSKEATFQGRGWQIESSLSLAQYTIQQALFQNVGNGAPGGYLVSSPPDAGASDANAADASSGVDAGTETDAAATDLAVLFAGIAAPNVRITRMRSDVAQSALSVDMILEASSDQSELSNIHTVSKEIGEPLCPVYDSNCTQTGSIPRSQAAAAAAAGASGGGCSTTEPRLNTGTTLAFLAGLGGLVAFRIRQKRRASR